MTPRRLRVTVGGAVQGVGFRPFVHGLAVELQLGGWVRNSGSGVVCEVEGARVDEFAGRVRRDAPANARIESLDLVDLAGRGERGFRICESDETGDRDALIQPDLAVCPACLAEILDPHNRRHRYPFTNCTRCGPRFSIVERIPYDRRNTTMRGFAMCPACAAEYDDPADRRFHAQPIACPDCGPRLWLASAAGDRLAERDGALGQAVQALRAGQIVAVKGIGGFHLLAKMRDVAVVRRLRERKGRGNKPFALMYPDSVAIEADCDLRARERELLQSAAAPIVLVSRRAGGRIPDAVAPGNPRVGVMLPYSPLHQLLLHDLGEAVVATSGNLAEEPICFENESARRELGAIADLFLFHDRPIRRPVDDSVVTVVCGREMILRRSRGYAPLPVTVGSADRNVLAVGADLKNTVVWLRHGKAFISQHLGDLGTERSLVAHERIKRDLPGLYPGTTDLLAHDLHPGYFSTRSASGGAKIGVQHHHAHIAAGLAEHGIAGDVLGVAFDGTGYGEDGTVWGGEFLVADRARFTRINWLRTFPLPGGEKAAREPRYTAAGLLHEVSLPDDVIAPLFNPAELKVLRRMLRQGLNCPRTSSVGRLFDGVAALLGLGAVNSFEGEAAMALEFACGEESGEACPVPDGTPIDWAPFLRTLLAGRREGIAPGILAARFHRWLVEVIAQVAAGAGQKTVVLSGGCFQNQVLLEATVGRLRQDGFAVCWPQHVPPNDGGLALGQAVVAAGSMPENSVAKNA